MRLKSIDRDILIVIILSSIGILLAITVPANWLPLRILTLPLVFILPGYALTSALLPTQKFGIERFVLSLGLSLAAVIVGGLLLNLTPFGLQTDSWALLLGGITLAACAVTIARRRRQGVSNSAFEWHSLREWRPDLRHGLFIGLALLLVGGAVAFSIIGAQQQPRKGFTQLWLLPAGGGSQAKNVVSLGISNMETQDMSYRLTVNMDGKLIKEWPSITLNTGQQWKATLTLPQPGHVGAARVEAILYRSDSPRTAYRDVVFWLNAT